MINMGDFLAALFLGLWFMLLFIVIIVLVIGIFFIIHYLREGKKEGWKTKTIVCFIIWILVVTLMVVAVVLDLSYIINTIREIREHISNGNGSGSTPSNSAQIIEAIKFYITVKK